MEEALCFGWIDSYPRKLDEQRRMLYFCPRRPKSVWSPLNKERVARLIKTGAITAAGLAKIEHAKKTGTWTALDASEALEIPDDLMKAFSSNQKAWTNFQAFPPGRRKIILYWITNARREVTRSQRIKETVELAARNIRVR